MPRGTRVLADGAYYHIYTRGNDRRRLFRCGRDYLYFLKTIKRYLPKFPVDIIHYCLMPNHFHLVIQALKAKDLPKFMQGLLQVYAGYFKKKYNSTGYVFQNRYKSKSIDKDSYLLECGRYIERNPLRANIVNDLLKYPWSSFLFYARGSKDDIITKVNPLYIELGKTEQERQQKYYKYVCEERSYEAIVDKAFGI